MQNVLEKPTTVPMFVDEFNAKSLLRLVWIASTHVSRLSRTYNAMRLEFTRIEDGWCLHIIGSKKR